MIISVELKGIGRGIEMSFSNYELKVHKIRNDGLVIRSAQRLHKLEQVCDAAQVRP